MTSKEIYDLTVRLSALTVFRGLLQKPPLEALMRLLISEGGRREKAELYGAFVYCLAGDGFDFSRSLCRAVYEDENEYIKRAAGKAYIPDVMSKNASLELGLLSELTKTAPDVAKTAAGCDGVPGFTGEYVDLAKGYAERIVNVGRYGYGLFSSAVMFRAEGRDIAPVRSPDTVSEDDLFGYEEQRGQLCGNIESLLQGAPASNVLLYGDAGTGKSSAVKAAVNKYADRGLRLIELRKNQLLLLPKITDRLRGDPLKFIIYIDDLSFTKNDDSFGMLKAALEGSASAASDNAIICATSNRRHIVRESFAEREGDDVHKNDTVQELMSLSGRFGLRIYFEKPDKKLYLYIVHKLLQKHGITADEEKDKAAEAFALSAGGRSPRTAEQFVKTEVIKRGTK